jgi:hypothetical protein
MKALRTAIASLVLAATLAGCVIYGGPYRPYRAYYGHACWHCGW